MTHAQRYASGTLPTTRPAADRAAQPRWVQRQTEYAETGVWPAS